MSLALDLERTALEPPAAGPAPLDYPLRRPPLAQGLIRRCRTWASREVEVLVRPGDRVGAGDVVARFLAAGRATAIDVAVHLGVSRERAGGYVIRRPGEIIAEGDVLAERRAFGGLQRRSLRSPATGRLSYVSPTTGTAYVEPLPVETRVLAHLAGTVVEAAPQRVVIEGEAVAIAGRAGAGPAAAGILLVADSPEAVPAAAAGTVVACAFPIDEAVVRRVADAGAPALIAAGIEDAAIDRLGWDDVLWPSSGRLQSRPAPPLTVALLATGPAAPLPAIWDPLRALAGRLVSVLGAEPGAATEVLLPLDGGVALPLAQGTTAGGTEATGLSFAAGEHVTVLAGRAEGLTGQIVAISAAPYRLSSELRTEVADVAFPYDVRLQIPLLHLQPLP